LFPQETDDDTHNTSSQQSASLHLMAVETSIKDPGTWTFQLHVVIQGHPVQLLIDLGSTHSFLNVKMASLCTGVEPLQRSLQVKVANGEQLVCATTVNNYAWTCDGNEFVS
jgi:predicted aspartyl protease